MNIINKKNIIIFSIFLLLLLISFIIISWNNKDYKKSESKEERSIVQNYSDFYTVSSCVYRFITYLNSKNTNSLLNVLDEDYLKENNINNTNLYNYLTPYEGNISFNARKMYEEKLTKNITKYYVYGYIEKDVINSFPEQIEVNYIVKLDKSNKVFSIMPYSEDIK